MNKIYFAFGIALLLVVAIAGGCRGPEGPAGPPGETTLLNLEGFAEGINCGDCHNPDQDSVYFVWAKKYQWDRSKHAYGGDYERNTASCAGCHTTEGFVEAMQGKTVVNHVDASPPGCFACHAPHARGDFSLRKQTPVTIMSNIVGVSDATFDYGKGNLCVQCHKTRSMSPRPDPTKSSVADTISITNNRWYAHYGVQGQMLMGEGGFKFSDYTYTGNSFHTNSNIIKQEGCISCHMADATAGSGIAGGHTMNIRYEFHDAPQSLLGGCNQSGCHANINTINYNGVQTTVHAYLDTLKTMMTDTAIVNKFNVGAKKAWLSINAEGAVTINASSGSPLKIRPASRSGALYNFLFVEHDLSEGIHNSKYAIELLKSSVAELRKP
ncbi:MAG TPA: hypothetical protein VIL52_01640 [Bacteroidota bacterium]